MLQTLQDNLSNAGADAAEGRARRILLGLGFSSKQMDSPVSQLSGDNVILPGALWLIACPLLPLGPLG